MINNSNSSSRITTKLISHLNLLLLNAQSITSKKASFTNLLNEHNPDIIAISETWLNPDILSSEFLPAEYTAFRRDRPDGYGGVLLACHNSLNCQMLTTDLNSEAIACQLTFENHNSLIVCVFYRPPNRSSESIINLCNFLKTIIDNYPHLPIWIAGDLNLPNIDWEINHINGSAYPSTLCELFLDFILEYGFIQSIKDATREQNILDVFFTNRPTLIQSCCSVPGISDHEAVLIKSLVTITPQKTKPRKIILWNKADIPSIKETIAHFSSEFFSNFSTSTPVDTLWEKFKSLCFRCISFIPTKPIRSSHTKPWISSYIRRLTRKKQRLFNVAKRTNCPLKWQAYKNIKKEVQQKCRTAYYKYITSLCDETGSVTKRLWSYIKQQRKDNCGVTSLRHDGTLYNDDTTKAQLLNDYFTSVFTPTSPSPPTPMDDLHIPDITDLSIDVNGVLKLMQEIDASKAAGPDGVPARFLKLWSAELAPILTLIFQASIHQTSIPLDWKQANIVPIFKKGDRTQCSNYRPVSLTCICSKLLEHILYSHIYSHLSLYNILCDEQHGFRHARSCESQLLLTINDLAINLNNRGQTDVIMLDFSKAFDKVSHQHLYHKLQNYGIRGNILEWLKHFLMDRSQRVIINGEHSNPARVTSGVPQGTVLAPLLFLCYINDLPNNIVSTIRLYADDVLIYTSINSEEDYQKLQQDLHTLERWAANWKMSFNIQKCEFLRITNKSDPIHTQYFLHNQAIREVTHTKYLGVIIDSKLSWSQHIKEISNKANRVKGFLQRNLQNCPPSVKANCYKSLIKPILEYACVVWAPYTDKDISLIESVQRRAARFVFNNYSSYSSVSEMIQRLNWKPLAHCRNQLKAITIFKIIHNFIDIPADIHLIPVSSGHYTRGHQMRFQQPMTRINSYLHSFFPSSIKIWNSLSDDIISCTTLEQFKQKLAGLDLSD